MSRLNPRQYELLVEYMEKHGDISKLSNGTVIGGSYVHHWARLTNILNSDSEPPRKTEIWKKVWSDLKANIKKKVARISQTEKSTRSVLSELEKRIINVQNQTVNITAEIIEYPEFSLKQGKSQKEPQTEQFPEKYSEFHVIHVEEAQSEEDHIDKLHDVVINSEEIGMEEIHNEEISVEKVQDKEVHVKQIHKDLSANSANKEPKPENPLSDSQSGSEQYTDDSDQEEPSKPPEKKPRLNLKRPLRSSYESRRMHSRAESPRRTREKEWLSFQKEIERDRIRIRKRELQHQGRWLDLFEQFLELGNRVVDVMERRQY